MVEKGEGNIDGSSLDSNHCTDNTEDHSNIDDQDDSLGSVRNVPDTCLMFSRWSHEARDCLLVCRWDSRDTDYRWEKSLNNCLCTQQP